MRRVGSELTSGCLLCSAAVPRLVSAGSVASAKGPSALVARAIAGPPSRNSANTGVAWSEKARSLAIVRRSWWSAAGKLLEPGLEVLASLRGRLGGDVRVVDEPRDVRRARAPAEPGPGRRRAASLAELLVLAGELGEHPVGLAQRRVGAPDDRGEVLPAGREPGAEVVEDQPEAVGVGLAHDVVDQVDVDFLAVVLQRQEVLPGSGLAVGDHVQRRRRLGARAPAAGSACSRRTSRPAATGDGSGRRRPGGSPGSRARRSSSRRPPCRDPALPSRCASSPGSVTSTERHRPDVGAGDPHLLAGDQEAAVVEDRADLVVVPVAARAPGRRRPVRPWPGARLMAAIRLMVPGERRRGRTSGSGTGRRSAGCRHP